MKRNIKLIVSCIAFIGLGIGIIGAGVNYFFNHSVLGMEQGLAGSTQNSNEANQVCYITPENPDADMTLEDTTEADLQAGTVRTAGNTAGTAHSFTGNVRVSAKKDCSAGAIRLHLDMDTVMKHSLQMADQIMDISGWTYPDTLQYYTGMDVYNLGVSGETSYEIATREGGLTMFVCKKCYGKSRQKRGNQYCRRRRQQCYAGQF